MTGEDDAGGSGIGYYTLYVSEDSGAYKLHQKNITAKTVSFAGTPGSTYRFFTLATDNTGNQEALKKTGELTVELPGLDIPLPVTWLYFNGAQQGNDVLLNWATTSETNSKEFIIERSTDSIQFTSVGIVAAKGQSNQTSNYQFLDTGAIRLGANLLYYRLKLVDNGGQFIHSIIVSVPIKQAAPEAIVEGYPNPITGRQLSLKIQTVEPTDQIDKVEIYTLDGQMIYQKRLAQSGSSTILLQDLPDLKAGLYSLRAVIGKKLYSIKLIRL